MPIVTSTANPAVKAARRLGRGGRAGGDAAFLVEGPQALREAGAHLRRLFTTTAGAAQWPALVDGAREAGAEVVVVDEAVLAAIATTVTPQAAVGVAVLPEPSLDAVLDDAVDARCAPLVVVLHQVRDPGNAGTVVRCADAAGADAVVLTSGSVDARNPKAVRASAGSLFHLPVVRGVAFGELADACRRRGIRLVAASATADRDHTATDLTAGTALVFGNEAHGLPAGVVAACDAALRVPLHRGDRPGHAGAAESLNLAAAVAVVAYEAARQRSARSATGPGAR